MDTRPAPHSQDNVVHHSAESETYLSRRDNHSDTSLYDRNEADRFSSISASHSNHGTQYGTYSMPMAMPFSVTGQANWTPHPSVCYGRPNESYGYPGGPVWFPYFHQQYSFPTSMGQPPPFAPPPAHIQQRNYSFPYGVPQPPSPLAIVPVELPERRLPPPPYTSSTPEHRYIYGSPFPTTSPNPSSDAIDSRRNSDQSEEMWGNSDASFYADVGISSSRSSDGVVSNENQKGKKVSPVIRPREHNMDINLWDDHNHTVQNRQIFHQEPLSRKQDDTVVMEKQLESEKGQKNPESTMGKSCYMCAELPWNKWASARPAGRRPMWSDIRHLSIRELDANISCFIKDYPQLIHVPSVKSQQKLEFIKKSLEEMENYLRKECQRSECQFLTDYPNQKFPLTSNALANRLSLINLAGKTVKTRQEKREKRSDITSFHEADLWAKGILGINNSIILLTTVHFYVSKCFGVRGQKKHQALRLNQFHFGEDPKGRYVRFHYDSNEIDIGATKNVIKHYDDLENPRSFYKIIKIYVDAIADDKFTIGEFYRRPNNNDNVEISFTWYALGGSEISGYVSS